MKVFRSKGHVWLATVGLLLFAAMIWLWQRSSPPPASPLPSPNGYDLFLQAYDLQKETRVSPVDLPLADLQEFVTSNAAAFQLIEEGLALDCQVPLSPVTNYIERRMGELSSTKQMAQSLAGRARLAEAQERPAEAVAFWLEALRFGHESVRGGVLIDGMVGLACQALSVQGLEAVAPTLDRQTCQLVLEDLIRIDANAEAPERFLEHEEWWLSQHGLARRWSAALAMKFSGSQQQAKQQFLSRHNQATARRRHLMVELAARAYQLEHGSPPKNASDLVPLFLPEIPVDATTGQPMGL